MSSEHTDSVATSELHAIRKQVTALERAVEENTRLTAEYGEVVKDVRDALVFARVGTKIIKWLGGIGAVFVTGFTLWSQWRKP